jgi:thioredoxin 1
MKQVLYFTASWCGPCQSIKPTFHDLEEEYSDKINFTMIDVDLNSDLAATHKVEAMPTFIFINEGRVIQKLTGAAKDKLQQGVKALAKA